MHRRSLLWPAQNLRRNKNVPGRAWLTSYLPISSFWEVSDSGTQSTCPWQMPGPLCRSTLTLCVRVCVCMRACLTCMGKLPCSVELTLEGGGAASLQSHTHEIVTIWQVEKIKTCRTRHLKYLCWKYKQPGGCKCGLKKISVFVEENFLMLFKKTERKTEKKERKGRKSVNSSVKSLVQRTPLGSAEWPLPPTTHTHTISFSHV